MSNLKQAVWVGILSVGVFANAAGAVSLFDAFRHLLIGRPKPASTTSLPARPFTCPQNLEPLTVALLRDLPGYINRFNFRLAPKDAIGPSYAIVASQPDFVPLPTESSEYDSPPDRHLHQIFFTVLERQYAGKRLLQFQHYHWLFLAQAPDGWHLAMLFSRLDSYPSGQSPLTPPRDSSQSITAEAIRSWLQNCEAGAVKP